MKFAGLLLAALLAITLPLAGQSNPLPELPVAKAPAEPAEKLSPQVSQLLTAQLPKYAPPSPEKPAATADPDVIELPKLTVTQKKRPRLNDQVMMTTKAFNEKLAKEQLSSFDRNFLNKFALPAWLSGTSAATRAREEYDRDQRARLLSDVARMAKVAEQIDPEQAKAMRDAAAKP